MSNWFPDFRSLSGTSTPKPLQTSFQLVYTVPVVLRNAAAGLLLKPVGPVIAGPGEKNRCAVSGY